ncbi:MAG: ribonuclease P protein component [Planctomycetes bacterium]|nr:ribonuclease P protein component [Planctomycetota bacterium]
MDEKLRKTERIRRPDEIDVCYRKGRRAATALLRVHVRPTERSIARLAVSVPGRLGNAVQRNRWKRLVREAFRRHKSAFGPGIDIVVVPARPPDGVFRPQVEAALLEAVRRARSDP